jgi:hypothetical protein
MANNFASNPLVFDSVPGVSLRNYAGPSYVPGSRFIVKKVVWNGSTTNAHTAVVTDSQGVVIASFLAVTGSIGITQTVNPNLEVTDLQVTALSSGTLYIYLQHLD